jgi:hypothetical protein
MGVSVKPSLWFSISKGRVIIDRRIDKHGMRVTDPIFAYKIRISDKHSAAFNHEWQRSERNPEIIVQLSFNVRPGHARTFSGVTRPNFKDACTVLGNHESGWATGKMLRPCCRDSFPLGTPLRCPAIPETLKLNQAIVSQKIQLANS